MKTIVLFAFALGSSSAALASVTARYSAAAEKPTTPERCYSCLAERRGCTITASGYKTCRQQESWCFLEKFCPSTGTPTPPR